jgi:hypothetical protein
VSDRPDDVDDDRAPADRGTGRCCRREGRDAQRRRRATTVLPEDDDRQDEARERCACNASLRHGEREREHPTTVTGELSHVGNGFVPSL